MDNHDDTQEQEFGRHSPAKDVMAAGHEYGSYYFRPGQLLLGGPDRFKVAKELGDRRTEKEPESIGWDLLRIELKDPRSVPAVVAEYLVKGGDAGAPSLVSPNHVLLGGSHMVPFPGGAPRRWESGEARAATPPEEDRHGRGVTVAVLDSGVDPEHEWLQPPHVERTDTVVDRPDPEGAGKLRRYAGHGTHIAGVIRRHAPGAVVLAHQLFGADGTVDDVDLARALEGLPDSVNVVNLSLGGYSHGDLGLPVTAAALAKYRTGRPGTVVVASAGNDNQSRPVWPAAFKQVVSVGALTAEGERACFSNFGWWVDACSVGVDVESSFVRFEGEPEPVPTRKSCEEHTCGKKGPFNGFAYWSGTSFAAPKVAAALACAIGDGASGPQAVLDLINQPTLARMTDLGTVVEVKPIF